MKNDQKIDAASIEHRIRETLNIESIELQRASEKINSSWINAVMEILKTQGRVVVMGMGKSGHIGRKIAATLASTGTPAMFVHPAEASHGDLGMILRQDIVMAISNSGESEELTSILPVLKRIGVKIIAITANQDSTLGRHANWVLESSVEKEACPLNLAPTASTTVQLAIGDALAVALLEARGFKADDFARSHPGGALGRKLLTFVQDVMRVGDDVPTVVETTSFTDLMKEMSDKKLGAAAVIDEGRKILGVFTDGDLRRLIETGNHPKNLTAGEVMSTKPKTIRSSALAVEAAELMEKHQITSIFVVDANMQICGALNSNDLMRAKVI